MHKSHNIDATCNTNDKGKTMGGTEMTLLWILAGILVVVGLAGTVLPMLPGVPFVFGGLLVAAWLGDFQRIGWPTLTVLGILMLIAMAVDFVATLLGAKRAGASKLALVGAAVGSIVGLFFGLIGIFIFPFVGAVIGEYLQHQRLGQAGKVGLATWIGLLFGAIAKFSLALTMIGIFAIAYFW
jgi:uncharacterized protein